MPYERQDNTWDIINPLIELAQEMTAVRIWDQEIRWGISWAAQQNTTYYSQGTNTQAVYDLGSGLSLIDAIITLNDGEVPESSVTYKFGVDGPVDTWGETTMALGWWYYGVEPYCYCIIGTAGAITEAGFTNQFNNLASTLSSRCGIHGFNPLNITDADRAHFTVYFCVPSVTDDDTRPAWMTQKNVMTWQLGDSYNTNRSIEPDYILTNGGTIYVTGEDTEIKIPAFDGNDPSASHTYYRTGLGYVANWHFPFNLAEDLNDFYEQIIEEDQIGGDGEYNLGGDSLGVVPVPKIGILQSGMVKLYLPTPLELKNFADELWNDNVSIASAFGAMVASPIEAVINLGVLPLDVSGCRDSAVAVKMGAYTMSSTMSPCLQNKEYFPFNLGTIRIPEKWGSALDYSPYTKLNLFLPYVGYVDLPPEEVLQRDLSVFYYINLFTGDFVAWVYTTKRGQKVSDPLMQYTGNMMFKMPVTAMDYSAYYKNQHDLFAGAMSSFASGNVLGGIIDSVSFAAGCAQPAGNVKRAGEFSGSTAIMAYPQPFIIRTVPTQVFQGTRQDQSGFDQYVGFPSYKILKLTSGLGFVKINDIILDGFVLTDEEEKEFRQILKEGVYL